MNVVEVSGTTYRDDEEGLVEVAGQDTALLREVRSLADDVVLAFVDICDERRPLLVAYDGYEVADGDRIGAADAFEPEVAFYLTFHGRTLVGLHGVPASGVLDDKAVAALSVLSFDG